MHTHSISQASLAFGIIEQITSLDEMLKLMDEEDRIELQERLAVLDPSEVQNIFALFEVKPVLAAVAGDSSGRPVEFWVEAAAAPVPVAAVTEEASL